MKSSLIFSMCLCLLAGGAAAQDCIDDDPDGVGIYFDEVATECMPGSTGMVQFTAYLVLTNMTGADVEAWVLSVGIEAEEEGLVLDDWQVRGLGMNLLTAPEFAVIHPTPLPGGPAVVLAEVTMLHIRGIVHFYLAPVDGVPGLFYSPGDTKCGDKPEDPGDQGGDCDIQMHPSSGSFDLPVACINCNDVIPTAGSRWGSVKALYR